MSLQLILGNSGSGKSHLLYEKIIQESMMHPERNYIVIVPEQFTMQTQKDLVMQHPDRGIMNIDVLSFRRLAHRVFEEVGADQRTILTETGKNLMLRKVAIEQEEQLEILGDRMNRPGYVSEVKSVLSELMQYEITDFEIQEMLRYTEDRPLLHKKLEDIRILYKAFLDYQRERFMKPEELMDVLCRVAGRSELLKKSTIAFDGFTGFTPSQCNVLEEILALCPKVWITVTIDAREALFQEIQEYELFALSKKTIRTLMEIANRSSAKKAEENFIEEPIILGMETLPRFCRGGALEHLEQNLFRKKRYIYKKKTDEISLHEVKTPSDEVHYLAGTISRLVREEGYRYQDIAVIAGNLSAYTNYVKRIFPQYKIPVFIDEKRQVVLNPCLEFIRGALAAVEKNFTAETVFRFLRTQMAGVSMEETDRLENYALAAGIRGRKKWLSKWEYLPGKMTPEELEQCNEYRERAMSDLAEFAEKIRRKNLPLRVFSEALYTLLENCGVQQILKDRETELKNSGYREEAKEYSQIYEIVIDLLDEMVELMGEEKVTLQEFTEILDAGFAEASVGIIPPGIDQVQVGDITRSRLAHVKVLFFAGLNDGWVPSGESGGGIVSDMEREILRESGISLAPSVRENSYIQRFYLYQNLTKPKDRLYLSWSLGSGDGSAMRPSYLVSIISRMFPEILIEKENEAGTSVYQITSRENGMLYLTRGLLDARNGQNDPEWIEVFNSYRREDEYQERIRQLVEAAFTAGNENHLSWQTSRELYGENMTNSVTRLEQFASCAFAHFVSYGLRLTERELYGVKPMDMGIVFHRAMELFSRRLDKSGMNWDHMPENIRTALMERCVDEIAEEYGAGVLHENAREEHTIRRMKRILCRTIWALHEQICAGEFRPKGFEVMFSDAGDLETVKVRFGENGILHLKGRIDRIDTAEKEDTVYVKIVDYKSGKKEFDPISVYYGLQLQLVVYMNAALEMEQRLHPGKQVIPAGIFYHHMNDPLLERKAGDSDEKAREELMKELRPNGLINDDRKILEMMDRQIGSDSLVIPVGYKKDGNLKASAPVASTEQFEQLSTFVEKKMQKMAAEILQGEITPSPFGDKNSSACDYCSFISVCGADRKIPDMCQKRIAEIDKDIVWDKIAEEAETGKSSKTLDNSLKKEEGGTPWQ